MKRRRGPQHRKTLEIRQSGHSFVGEPLRCACGQFFSVYRGGRCPKKETGA